MHGAGSGVCSVSSELSTWRSVLRVRVTSARVSPVPSGAVSVSENRAVHSVHTGDKIIDRGNQAVSAIKIKNASDFPLVSSCSLHH